MMGRKNYPPKEKKKRKLARKTKLGQELIEGLKDVLPLPQEKKKPLGRSVMNGMSASQRGILDALKKRAKKGRL
jgi:hypothetical protein